MWKLHVLNSAEIASPTRVKTRGAVKTDRPCTAKYTSIEDKANRKPVMKPDVSESLESFDISLSRPGP